MQFPTEICMMEDRITASGIMSDSGAEVLAFYTMAVGFITGLISAL
jgi:hypothetical protein